MSQPPTPAWAERRIKPGFPRLVGSSEAAEICGIPQASFNTRYRNEPNFPLPVAILKGSTIWLRDDIVAYAQRAKPARPTRRRITNA